MSLTSDQIQRIRNRLPGWEDDWGQLCIVLLGHDGGSGDLVQAVKSLAVIWPSQFERDDFISTMMVDYNRRAREGTLLLSYEPDEGDVVAFLTSRSLLRQEAIKSLRRLSAQQMLSLDDPRGDSVLFGEGCLAANPHDAAASEFGKLVERLQEQLQAKLEDSKRVTRVIEQAAIQLYPRLDWSRSAMEPLRDHLVRVLRAPSDGADPLAALEQAHNDAERTCERRLDELAAKVHNQGSGVSVRRRERLERRIGHLYFERFFLPIADQPLAELLGITRADAAQRRSRFRVALPELLAGIAVEYAEYQALQEHSSPGPRRRLP